MQLQKRYAWNFGQRGKPFRYSVSQAIADECDGSDCDRGSLEAAAATANNAAEFLGRLVGKLHELGALKDEDVLALLPGYEKAED